MATNRAMVMSDGILGGTFMDWSLMFFSRVTSFYNPLNKLTTRLSLNPVSGKNAHAHNRIHPVNFKDTVNAFNSLSSYPGFYSMYPIIDQSTTQYKNKITSSYSALNNIAKLQYQLFVANHGLKTCHIVESEEHRLYYFFNQGRPRNLSPSSALVDFCKIHFNESYNTIWEFREMTALSIRPFNIPPRIRLDLPKSLLFVLSFSTVLTELDSKMPAILDFFEINYTPEQFNHWMQVYYSWKEIHLTSFYLDWKEIVDAIVTGRDIDLSIYRKELVHDVFLQHILLYKYNLSIKGCGLTSLPMSTAEIHYLLEENFHQLDKDYQNYVKHL